MPVTVGGLIAGAFTALAEGAGAIAPEVGLATEAGAAADVGAGAAVGAADVGAATAAGAGAAGAGGFDLATIGPGVAAAPGAAAGVADAGAVAAGSAAGGPLDLLAGGTAAGTAADTALASAAPLDLLAGGQTAGTAATDIAANAVLPETAVPSALTGQSPFDTGFTSAVPFTNETLGGGFPQVAGGTPGTVADFSPSTIEATGVPTLAAQSVGAVPPVTAAPSIPASVDTTAADITGISQSTGALPPGTSLETPTGAVPGAAGGGLSSALRTAGLLAPLGALGLTLARGQPGVSPATQTALNQTAPFSSYAASQLAAAQANQLTPAQAASIAVYKQNAQNQLYQLYAREGREPTNDSDYIQGLAAIDQQALAMQATFVQDMVNNAIAAQGVSDNVLQTAANEQVANDNNFQTALNSSLQSFGLVAAINTIGTKAA